MDVYVQYGASPLLYQRTLSYRAPKIPNCNSYIHADNYMHNNINTHMHVIRINTQHTYIIPWWCMHAFQKNFQENISCIFRAVLMLGE